MTFEGNTEGILIYGKNIAYQYITALQQLKLVHEMLLLLFYVARRRLVGWSLTSLFSTNMAISETRPEEGLFKVIPSHVSLIS